MGSVTGSAIYGFLGTIAASGTFTFPTWFDPTYTSDYDVQILEGEGAVDAASKTLTTVDFTVTAGPLKFKVVFNKPGMVAHVN